MLTPFLVLIFFSALPVFSFLVWAAFVNTVSSDGLSDIVLTAIAIAAFVIGFLVGVLKFGRWAGVLLLGVLGGFSIGIRVVLLRPGLLVPDYRLNWLVLAVFFVIGLFLVLLWQHFGIVSEEWELRLSCS